MTSYSAKLCKPVVRVYHERESIASSAKLLLTDKEASRFWVTCSKALLNCVVQRHHFKEHLQFRIDPQDLDLMYSRLRLFHHFKIQEINKWSNSKADSLGSILAITKALATINVTLTPVDDMIYTSLIEKPTAYVCLIEDGWVVLRKISEKWYFLDPRTSEKKISDTYLHLLIKQLILDKGLVFQVGGGEFSQMTNYGSASRPQLASNVGASSGEASDPCDNRSTEPDTSDGRNSRRRSPEPKPPDIPRNPSNASHALSEPTEDRQSFPNYHQVRRDEMIRMFTHLSKLQLGAIINRSSRRSSVRRPDGASERSRSEVRRGSPPRRAREGPPSSGQQTDLQAAFNDNWPSLEAATQRSQRKRRTQSIPRSRRHLEIVTLPPEVNASSSKCDEKSEWSTGKGVSKESCCCICLEGRPSHALYPCGHQCLCALCKTDFLKSFTTCPICKSPVSDAIRIYKT